MNHLSTDIHTVDEMLMQETLQKYMCLQSRLGVIRFVKRSTGQIAVMIAVAKSL